MPLYEMLKQHEANSHYCHQFCSMAGAESAPRAPSPVLPDRVVQDDFQGKHVSWPEDTYQQRRDANFTKSASEPCFFSLPAPPPHPPHSIWEQSAEEGCVRLAHASPGTRRSGGRAELTAMLALQARTPITFQVPPTATTPVPGT